MNTRVRREDPDREEPIRSWDTLFRSEEAGSPRDSGGDHAGPGAESESRETSWEQVANRAIERGYHVIEEQIRQGQRIAEELRGRAYDMQSAGNDASRLVERTLRFYADVGSLWFELVESMLRNPAMSTSGLYGASPAAAAAEHDAGEGPPRSGRADRGDLDVEVSSPLPVRVTLELNEPVSATLTVPALRALDPDTPPLRDVRFEAGPGRPALRIRVPRGQPAGVYSGVIVDGATNQPRGTLCIRLNAEEEEAAP